MNPQTLVAIEALFAWAWKTSLQATLLILLVWMVQLACRRFLAPRWRYALGMLILFRLALPVAPASHFSIFNLFAASAPHSPQMPAPVQSIPPPIALSSPEVRMVAAIPAEIAHFPLPAFVWIAGSIALLVLAMRQQRRLSLQLRNEHPVEDPAIVALIENCKAFLGIKKPVRILATLAVTTPALFGVRRPRLLIPAEMLKTLDERELRIVLLHELTHLKRGDVLVNWVIILVRSLHWFNPFAWLALKRLRADQELACDAAVMTRLCPDERRLYGDTLIRLVAEFSSARFCPGLVPFITQTKLIKRRITMIAKFRPSSRAALAGSLVMLAALGCFTFTRASEKPAMDANPNGATGDEKMSHHKVVQRTEQTINALESELDRLTEQVKKSEAELFKMRKDLNIPNDVAEGQEVAGVDRETAHKYESVLLEAQTQYVSQETMLSALKKLSPTDLQEALTTAQPDALLTSQLEQLSQAETKLAGLRVQAGDQNPDVQTAKVVVQDLREKVHLRINGILKGMETKVAALKAVVENSQDTMERNRKIGDNSAEAYQPYFDAKHDLETLQKSRDAVLERLNQEKLDYTILKSGQPR